MRLLLIALMTITAQLSFGQNNLINIEDVKNSHRKIDCRSVEEYQNGHLIDAININRNEIIQDKNELHGFKASRTQLEKLFSQKGINSSDTLLLYDNGNNTEALRLWWILQTYNFKNTLILNGGVKYIEKNTSLFTKKTPHFTGTNFQLPQGDNKDIETYFDEVKASLKKPEVILLDTRSKNEFMGYTQRENTARAGRIPYSINLDWCQVIDYHGNKRFKSKEELQKLFDEHGVSKDKQILVYCQSGVRSAHTLYVLKEILGYPNVKNYDGSWIEWSYSDEYIHHGETSLVQTLINAYINFAAYTFNEITFQATPWYVNYFYALVLLSLMVWGLEILFPWRKKQAIIRKDFWLDTFYMFFNFYIFKLVIFIAFSDFTEKIFRDLIGGDVTALRLFDVTALPYWSQLLIFFLATDFIQWFTHVLLHRYDFLWRFHKVHHSVEQMGFAAHLRYHWMENVFYTPMKYLAVAFIGGFSVDQLFIVYYTAIAIGHLNHANIKLDWGPFKYILNSPAMHIWHHAHDLPENRRHGVNFGISLSIWDYLFRTNYIPHSGRDIKLGFDDMESFPQTFKGQLFSGFTNDKPKDS